MKKIVSVIIVMVMLVLCFTLSSCDIEYASIHSATGMETKITSNEAFVSFDTFSGNYKIQLNSKSNE
ncbi:MAG: hypothetical protein K2N42_02665, partial [Anaeroplasmataceae bacterium]|nr:hypothetical protein [Anaeroplasmataceae bacterium]